MGQHPAAKPRLDMLYAAYCDDQPLRVSVGGIGSLTRADGFHRLLLESEAVGLSCHGEGTLGNGHLGSCFRAQRCEGFMLRIPASLHS